MNFDQIYEEYFNRIYKFINVRVMNSEDAEDITVKVFENIYRKMDSYSVEKGSLDLWIFTIARNEIATFFRGKKVQLVNIENISEVGDISTSPEHILEESIKNKRLMEAIKKLNDNEKFIVSCRYGGNLSNKEIGELMGISSSNVGVVLFRSMKKLKKELEG